MSCLGLLKRSLFLQFATLLACFAAGAAEPRLVADINVSPSIEHSNPQALGQVGGWTLFHVRHDWNIEGALWRTDGTVGGTLRIHLGEGFVVTTDATHNPAFAAIGGIGYFIASDAARGTEIWRTDGTSAGTYPVSSLPGNTPDSAAHILGVANSVLIVNTSAGLVRSDGTAAGTLMISDVRTTRGTFIIGGPDAHVEAVSVGNRIFFAGDLPSSDDAGRELWVTDGSTNGTRMIADLRAGPSSSMPRNFVALDDRVLFTAQTSTSSSASRLCSLDLATAAVTLLDNTFGSEGAALARLNDIAMFVPGGTATTAELWRSDGTPGGTFTVLDLDPAAPVNPGSLRQELTIVGDRALFTIGAVLWSTDGTSAQTVQITQDGQVNYLIPLAVIGDRAYFTAGRITSFGMELLQTDGTPAGTFGLPHLGSDSPHTVLQAHGEAAATYVFVDSNLWRHDPVTRQSELLMTSANEGLAMVGSSLLFSGRNGDGREPWITDGTVAGTKQLVDATPRIRNSGSDPLEFAGDDGLLFFTADDGINGRQVWRTDGTQSGTRRLSSFASAEWPQLEVLFSVQDSVLVNTLRNTTHAFWQLPAAGGEPVKLADIRASRHHAVLDDIAYFTAAPDTFLAPLWRTDATPGGTRAVFPPSPEWRIFSTTLLAHRGQLYFLALRDNSGAAWVSDGSADGTCKLMDSAGGLYPRGDGVLIRGQEQIRLTTGNCGSGTLIGADPFPSRSGSFHATDTGLALAEVVDVQPGPPPFVWRTQVWFNALDGTPNVRLGGDLPQQATIGVIGADVLYIDNDSRLMASDGGSAPRTLLELPDAVERSRLYPFNGRLAFFTYDSAAKAATLWTTDGTTAGTRSHGSLPQPAPTPDFVNRSTHVAGHRFYFAHLDAQTGWELYALENEAPIAAADASGSVEAGLTLQLDVIGNDRDPDGFVKSARIVRQPSRGSVTVAANGVITYAPRTSESGDDSFEYAALDDQGRESNRVTINVSVTPSTAPPPPPPGGGKGGGGGAVRAREVLGALLLLSLLCFRRRADRKPN